MIRRYIQLSILPLLVVGCLLSAPGMARSQEGRIPVTTPSEQARTYFLKGLDLAEKFRHAEARAFFEKALEQDPNLAMAHLYLAFLQPTTRAAFQSLYRAKAFSGEVSE